MTQQRRVYEYDGYRMVSSERFGRNFYDTVESAVFSAVRTLRNGAPYFIWRTVEGLYDWTAIPDNLGSSWNDGRVLVKQYPAATDGDSDVV